MPDTYADTYEGPFSLLRMFWGNLASRPLRCALSILAIAIQVVLVLMIVGLTSGVIAEWGKRVEGVGADILVQPPNSSIFFAFSSAIMPRGFRPVCLRRRNYFTPLRSSRTRYEVWASRSSYACSSVKRMPS